jgi:DUF917 family protein
LGPVVVASSLATYVLDADCATATFDEPAMTAVEMTTLNTFVAAELDILQLLSTA